MATGNNPNYIDPVLEEGAAENAPQYVSNIGFDDTQTEGQYVDTIGFGSNVEYRNTDLGDGIEYKNADSGESMLYKNASEHVAGGVALEANPQAAQESYTAEDGTRMFGIHPEYVGENEDRSSMNLPRQEGYLNRTHYADDAEREGYLSYVDEDGHFRSADGTLLDSAGTAAIHTKGIGGHLFVADEQGQSYVVDAHAEQKRLNQAKDESGVYQYAHHSTLAGGMPVSGSGEQYFEEGELLAISDQSGHYFDTMDPREATGIMQTLLSDLDAGADLSHTNVHLVKKTYADGTTVLPGTDSTVDEFLLAEGDQELLYTLELSAQEYCDEQAAASVEPYESEGSVEVVAAEDNNFIEEGLVQADDYIAVEMARDNGCVEVELTEDDGYTVIELVEDNWYGETEEELVA